MERRLDQGYFPETTKLIFILDTSGQEVAVRREFELEGLVLYFFIGRQYIEAYLGPQKKLVAWVKPQVGEWAHRVRVIGKIA